MEHIFNFRFTLVPFEFVIKKAIKLNRLFVWIIWMYRTLYKWFCYGLFSLSFFVFSFRLWYFVFIPIRLFLFSNFNLIFYSKIGCSLACPKIQLSFISFPCWFSSTKRKKVNKKRTTRKGIEEIKWNILRLQITKNQNQMNQNEQSVQCSIIIRKSKNVHLHKEEAKKKRFEEENNNIILRSFPYSLFQKFNIYSIDHLLNGSFTIS